MRTSRLQSHKRPRNSAEQLRAGRPVGDAPPVVTPVREADQHGIPIRDLQAIDKITQEYAQAFRHVHCPQFGAKFGRRRLEY